MIQGFAFSKIYIWLDHVLCVVIMTCTIKSASTSSQLLHGSAIGSSPVLSGSCLATPGVTAAAETSCSSSCSCSSSLGPWYDFDRKRNMAEDSMKCAAVPSNSNENAIVLYSPPIFEQFHQSERTFHLASRDFSIKQNWADFGVAAVVWDAAIVLCEHLESETKTKQLSLEGKRVIELGAGTGLVGMVASHLKGHLTITDRASIFKPLRDNVLRNFSPLSSSVPSPSSSFNPAASSSSNPNAPSKVNSTFKPPPPIPAVKVLEWGQDLHIFSEPFDIILGADIIYIEDTFQDLLQTLLHLSNEDTLILLSCRIRYKRDNNFLDMMKEKFQVEHVLHDSERGIEIYSAKKH